MEDEKSINPSDESVRSNPTPQTLLEQLLEGLAFYEQGHHPKAKEIYEKVLKIEPNNFNALQLLGTLYLTSGENLKALTFFDQALAIDQTFPLVYSNKGNALQELNRLEEALQNYNKAISLKPDYAEAYSNRGNVLRKINHLHEALASFEKAISLKPDYAEAYSNRGDVLQVMNKLNDALDSYDIATKINPTYAQAYSNKAAALQKLCRFHDSVAVYNQAISLNPNLSEAYCNRGNALKNLGQLNEAENNYRKAIQIKPDYAEARSNLLFMLSCHNLRTTDEYLELACEWDKACLSHEDMESARWRSFNGSALVSRRLRVGYVSGDFCAHAIRYFIEQLFLHHDRTKIELFAYSNTTKQDAITQRLKQLVEHWLDISYMSDDEIQARIELDGIDVLIDLSGHTDGHRLGVFARRAAPVQVHYLGYFASTGLAEMDYWIGDSILTPEENNHHFREKVWRLPRVWVSYEGKTDAPLPRIKPRNDHTLRLGSFNNLSKINPQTLILWAKILQRIPHTKLLLKTKELADEINRNRILTILSEYGISSNRIELHDITITPSWSEHMSFYDEIDIALDPIGGVGGGTTTCDALWMGIPVVTLIGTTMGQRMSASMLEAIGHPEWITKSEEEYILKISDLANKEADRQYFRVNLREQMRASQLCNACELARCLEVTYATMFEYWRKEKSLKNGT